MAREEEKTLSESQVRMLGLAHERILSSCKEREKWGIKGDRETFEKDEKIGIPLKNDFAS